MSIIDLERSSVQGTAPDPGVLRLSLVLINCDVYMLRSMGVYNAYIDFVFVVVVRN